MEELINKLLERVAKLEDRDLRKEKDIEKLFKTTEEIKKEQNDTNVILARMDEGINKLVQSDEAQQKRWKEWDETQRQNANKVKTDLFISAIKWIGTLAVIGFGISYFGGK